MLIWVAQHQTKLLSRLEQRLIPRNRRLKAIFHLSQETNFSQNSAQKATYSQCQKLKINAKTVLVNLIKKNQNFAPLNNQKANKKTKK